MRPREIEPAGGFDDVPLRLLQRLAQQVALEAARRFLEGRRAVRLVGGGVVGEEVAALDVSGRFAGSANGGCLDGVFPNGLIIDAKGNLYGTAFGGGVNNNGTIFMITP